MGGVRVLVEAISQATGGSWIGQGLAWLVLLVISLWVGEYLSRRGGKAK